MKRKLKARNSAKRGQRKASQESIRRRIAADAGRRVQSVQKGKRVLIGSQKLSPALLFNSEVDIPVCNGVGDCCKNRALHVEPSDVLRILNNENARSRFGIETTSDLYPRNSEETKAPLSYGIDPKFKIPFCSVRLIDVTEKDGSVEKHCPFMEHNDGGDVCMLGSDRLTQCRSDPLFRMGRQDADRVSNRNRFAGWNYGFMDQVCSGCHQYSKENTRGNGKVEDWLLACGMESRLLESDMFHGTLGWLKSIITAQEHWMLAAMLLFDWERFFEFPMKSISLYLYLSA